MNIINININELQTEGLQTRAATNGDVVIDYAELMSEETDFPPIVVYRDSNNNLYLADGFHRVAAARSIGREVIKADVRDGTFDDALRFALCANATNGLRRTNADKQRAMELAWANREMLFKGVKLLGDNGLPSCRQFASICGVSRGLTSIFFNKTKVSNFDTPSIVTHDEATDEASDEDAELTATSVTREHLEERNPKVRAKLKQGCDRFGMPIPDALLPVFLTTQPKRLLRTINGVTKELDDSIEHGELTFRPIHQQARQNLKIASRCFFKGQPYCVCRGCQGHGCYRCNSLGFQTRQQYDNLPDELKASELQEEV